MFICREKPSEFFRPLKQDQGDYYGPLDTTKLEQANAIPVAEQVSIMREALEKIRQDWYGDERNQMLEIRDIHMPFAKWLDSRGIPYHRSRSDKRTTATNGDPDFIICWCSHVCYIECKLPGKTLSEAQEKRVAYLRKAGNKVVVAYSLEMCIEAAKNILCLEGGDAKCNAPAEHSRALSARSTEQCRSAAVTSEPETAALFILNIMGTDWVCKGQRGPGGTVERVRRASPADLINIPR